MKQAASRLITLTVAAQRRLECLDVYSDFFLWVPPPRHLAWFPTWPDAWDHHKEKGIRTLSQLATGYLESASGLATDELLT